GSYAHPNAVWCGSPVRTRTLCGAAPRCANADFCGIETFTCRRSQRSRDEGGDGQRDKGGAGTRGRSDTGAPGGDNGNMSAMRPTDPRAGMQPRGDEIAKYETYLEAQRAVDYLADHEFTVNAVTIVGTELKMVERIT